MAHSVKVNCAEIAGDRPRQDQQKIFTIRRSVGLDYLGSSVLRI